MKRLTRKDEQGRYYLTGYGIYSDWGVPEKFYGDDVDDFGQIEDILGETYDLDRLRELIEANRSGRCVPVTKDLLIAILAGLYALNTNKKMRGGMYVFDVHKEHGGPHTMEFSRAAQILAETAERVLDASDDVLTGKRPTMSERKPLTDEYLDSIWKEMLKSDAKKPPRLDRSAWKCGICEVPTHWVEWGKLGYEYCPYCGRPLTDAAWDMLEKRLEVCK